MTNKTIDVSEIPVTERLTIARKLDAGEKTEFHGRIVVNSKSAAVKSEALAAAPATYRLTQARLSAAPKPEHTEHTAPRGAFIEGEGFVWFDETD